jgi:AraC-like DNA-binding protein
VEKQPKTTKPHEHSMPFFSRTFLAETRTSYAFNTSCFSVKIEPFDKAEYKSIVEMAELESLTLALVYNASAIIERQWKDMSAEDAKHFAIVNVLEGEMMITNDQGTTMLKSGEFMLTDNTQPRKIFVYKNVKVLIAYISRQVLKRYIPVPAEVLSQVVRVQADEGGKSPFSPILKLWEHLKEGRLEEFSAGISTQFLQDISDTYANKMSGAPRSRHAQRFRSMIKAYVEANLSDPQFSSEAVATEFKISSRYVRYLFSGGERLPLYIQRRRIEESAKLLAGGQYQASSITEIAHRCGFKSSAHFAHCFRAHFHETAREFRQRHQQLWQGKVPQPEIEKKLAARK